MENIFSYPLWCLNPSCLLSTHWLYLQVSPHSYILNMLTYLSVSIISIFLWWFLGRVLIFIETYWYFFFWNIMDSNSNFTLLILHLFFCKFLIVCFSLFFNSMSTLYLHLWESRGGFLYLWNTVPVESEHTGVTNL